MPSNKIWVFLILVFLIFTFTHCTSRYSQTSTKEILSNEWISAKTSPISLQIPIDWQEIDANDSTFIDIWLVSEDYNSSLSLIPLHSQNKQSLSAWLTTSKLMNKMKFDNIEIINEETLELNSNQFSFYHFKNDTSYYRVSIFNHKDKYYELTAFIDNSINNKSERSKIINIQNAVLNSIR